MVSRKRKAVVGLVGLVLVGGVLLGGVAAAPVAGAASEACGSSCVSMYNQKFGSADVSAVSGGNTATGQAVILAAAAPSTTEDWSSSFQGAVSDFYAAGLMNATLNEYYGSDPVYEFQYTPGGIDSGECLGIASGPRQGTEVTLQPCTEINSTWIDDVAAASGGYVPYISGSDTKYPAPYVLTASEAGGDFTTQALQANSQGIAAKDQMWQLISGVLGWSTDWANSSFCSRSWLYAPNGVPYIGITYKGVAACGNSVNVGNNQGPIYYNGVYFDNGPEPGTGFQCVELAARYFYFETMQNPPVPPNGAQFAYYLAAAGYQVVPVGLMKGTSQFDSSLTAGNIISMWSASDSTGHVAVVTKVSVSGGNGIIYVMDENASAHPLPGGWGNDMITVRGNKMSYEGLYDQFQWTTNLPGSG